MIDISLSNNILVASPILNETTEALSKYLGQDKMFSVIPEKQRIKM